jgi:hypothetical protein
VTQIDASATSCHSTSDGQDAMSDALHALVGAIADHRRRMAGLIGGLDELSNGASDELTAQLRASDDRLGDLTRDLERYLDGTTFVGAPTIRPTAYVST